MRRIKLHSHIDYRCHSMSCVFSFAENYRLLPFNRWPITCIATRFIPAEIFAVSGITLFEYPQISCFIDSRERSWNSEERKRMIPTEKKRISCKYCPTIHNCSALKNKKKCWRCWIVLQNFNWNLMGTRADEWFGESCLWWLNNLLFEELASVMMMRIDTRSIEIAQRFDHKVRCE